MAEEAVTRKPVTRSKAATLGPGPFRAKRAGLIVNGRGETVAIAVGAAYCWKHIAEQLVERLNAAPEETP